MTIPSSNQEKQFVEAEVRTVIAKLGPGIDRLDVNVAEISGEWQGVKHVPENKSAKWSIEEIPKPSKVWPLFEPRYHFYSDIPLHPLVSISSSKN